MPCNSHCKARRGALRRLAATFVVLLLTGCGTLSRHPVPLEAQNDPSIPGFTDIRFFPLTDVEPMREAIRQAFLTETLDNYETLADGWRRYNYLAISGGGSDGAFGAAILWDESIAENKPLKELVTTYITPDVLDAIAMEHAKGRRLYIASTNMDREEPVVWDMGAIASSTDPAKLELFRSVLIASASIPAIFPPTLVKVTLDGEQYDELHCDGGVFFQSFFIGAVVDLPALIHEADPDYKGRIVQDLYVIRNGSTTPARKQIPRGLRSISGRAIATMLKVSGINDLCRLFLSTERDDVDFYFVSLPVDYVRSTDEEFNEAEMNRQYQLGYELGTGGVPWRRLPPGYVLKDQGTTIAAQ